MTRRVDPRGLVLDQAAHWLARMHASNFSAEEQVELKRWRATSAMHEHVWQHAEQLQLRMGSVPPEVGVAVLGRPRVANGARRQWLRVSAWALLAPAAGWLAYRQLPVQVWTAQYRTGTGEQRAVTLADGTRVHLNTDSAMSVNFSRDGRLIRLFGGEILVETAHAGEYGAQPFWVQTEHGRMQALGTRFVVRPQAQGTALSVLEGAVRVMPDKANESIVVRAGEQTRFSASDIESIQTAPAQVDAWIQGVLYAQNMRLEEFLAELARYRSGVLHCDQSVADLRVSGAFQLRDTDRILALLAQTLPVQIRTRTRLWVTVSNRS